MWRLTPSRVRVVAYNTLWKIGLWLYGRTSSETVQRLPFGLYLKYWADPEGLRNEFRALEIVRRLTSVPVPKPLDLVLVQDSSPATIFTHEPFLLITRVPGRSLAACGYMFSDVDIAAITTQMEGYLTQLRAIPNSVSTKYSICDTLGGPCRDPRISGGSPVGPFEDEASFNQTLRFSDDVSRTGHKIVFTHADLNLRNILVDLVDLQDGTRGWRITGIVDWETAGFYPEYWDYTKSLFEGFRWTDRLQALLHSVFKRLGNYSKEFDVEKRSWESGDGV